MAMESRHKVFGHAAHPMLIPFPLGLLATAVVFDIISLFTDASGFTIAAFFMIAAGIIGGLLAAVFGFLDWGDIPTDTRAKRVGMVHGVGNFIVVVLFAVSWVLRLNETNYEPGVFALVLSFVGGGIAAVTGWMGGELVERLGVGVDPGAHVDAPSSLRAPAPGQR